MRRIGKAIRRRITPDRQSDPTHQPIKLIPEGPAIGRVLMSYATKVYNDILQGKPLDKTHVSAWQNFQISRAFLDLGFEVEVFHFEDARYRPEDKFDVVVDIMSNLGRLADSQSYEAIKILYPTFAHWTVHNLRSYQRHRAIAERRGVAIAPKRLVVPNDSVERSDHVLCKGGDFGRSTYAYTETPVTPVNQLRPHAIDEFIERKPDRCRKNFVWIGGSSAVHKGLDLVLEAFTQMPGLKLTVIGNVPDEKRFCAVYRKELFEAPNINVAGWVDTLSPRFREICENSVAIIAPSATELGCGSVIAGMMNGLVPIVSEGTDVDVSGFGILLEKDTVPCVRSAVEQLSASSAADLRVFSGAAREASQLRYGSDLFLSS